MSGGLQAKGLYCSVYEGHEEAPECVCHIYILNLPPAICMDWRSRVVCQAQGLGQPPVREPMLTREPSSPGRLLKRIQNMELENVSVGGVFGSKHNFSELNLVGSPRLDLSIHSPEGSADLRFVERLVRR